jgi:arsenite methyltransferase
MKTEVELKKNVQEKYAEIANQALSQNLASCCGATGCGTEVYNIMAEDYNQLDGYNADADLGLGCGLPTEFAQIKEGDTVIDLGSGAGNDCFVARKLVGDTGKVIGIDFTEAMLIKARENAAKLNFTNVEFRQGDIDDMPVADNYADVIVSNCVLNLVPNKPKVIAEIFRTLKHSGHFSISDIVLEGDELPNRWKEVAELYAGCVSGATKKDVYLNCIYKQGFTNIKIQKDREIIIPDNILAEYLSTEEIAQYRNGTTKIKSITVYAQKPELNKDNCCAPNSACC